MDGSVNSRIFATTTLKTKTTHVRTYARDERTHARTRAITHVRTHAPANIFLVVSVYRGEARTHACTHAPRWAAVTHGLPVKTSRTEVA